MSIYDTQPQNRNFLSPLNFQFSILRAPTVNFFIQKVKLPSVRLQSADMPNPFVKIPYPGEHLDYESLEISFKVDEDLTNYLEIHNWIKALGKPKSFHEYKDIESNPSYTGNGIYSDISLIILNSVKKPNFETIFTDAYPVSISALDFNTTDTDVNFITASASFKYTYYDIIQLTD